MPFRLSLRQLAFIAALSSFLLYQNCSNDGQSDTFNSASSFAESLPFAYDAKVDTIAYMSCSEMQEGTYEPRAYFSFRAGAYSSATGGLGLTTAFRTATQYYTPTDRGNVLEQSNNNSNTLLNLSIRSRSNFQSLWATDQVTIGHEIDDFLPEIASTPDIAGPLASESVNQYINYFPGTESQRLMEASLRFVNFENVANETRNNLSGQTSILVVGYSKSADPLDPSLRTPNDFPLPTAPTPTPAPAVNSNTQAFGTGFQVGFGLPQGYQSGDHRVISTIGELDLTSNTNKTSAWDCSTNYEFMVIRPEDLAQGLVACGVGVDRPANSTEQAALNAIRRVLRVEDWFVDTTHHCIVPKHTGDLCYGTGNTFGARSVQYGIAQCVDSPTTACPHFVSVCIRH